MIAKNTQLGTRVRLAGETVAGGELVGVLKLIDSYNDVDFLCYVQWDGYGIPYPYGLDDLRVVPAARVERGRREG